MRSTRALFGNLSGCIASLGYGDLLSIALAPMRIALQGDIRKLRRPKQKLEAARVSRKQRRNLAGTGSAQVLEVPAECGVTIELRKGKDEKRRKKFSENNRESEIDCQKKRQKMLGDFGDF
ncbi:hypothetical protein [Candidatus Magnetaquiglobus chichijimensis]|uniref:hypothetical protein n=1 Tax=Candidatus Magnetaquiglobus chichijimensis TaxID=3141448 RepID=UPI003B97CD54